MSKVRSRKTENSCRKYISKKLILIEGLLVPHFKFYEGIWPGSDASGVSWVVMVQLPAAVCEMSNL